ncbi:hypothetical protein, partial [Actinoalloteichus caeruleus]|uniref:hypothetical protein n=1 Tax=Actinoalloteichus cyanogriseus TaxID=2893586 RepID=UPI001B808469
MLAAGGQVAGQSEGDQLLVADRPPSWDPSCGQHAAPLGCFGAGGARSEAGEHVRQEQLVSPAADVLAEFVAGPGGQPERLFATQPAHADVVDVPLSLADRAGGGVGVVAAPGAAALTQPVVAASGAPGVAVRAGVGRQRREPVAAHAYAGGVVA